jgi:hypothetical protein
MYLARSNSLWYPGALERRALGKSGWQVKLDCGELKVVEDREIFRLREA